MSDELIAAAEIGDEAKSFMESQLGQVMLGMAKQDAQIAMETLSQVDCTDSKKIRVLQNTVYLANTFEQWLNELFSKGENALAAFKQQEN